MDRSINCVLRFGPVDNRLHVLMGDKMTLDQMTHGFEVVPAMLEASGFDAVTCFEGRKPFWVKVG